MKLNTMQYKGYTAKLEYDDDDGLFYGDVLDLRDVITFTGSTVDELREGFHEAVDVYLEWCEEQGKKPDKPFSGRVQWRTDSKVHREAVAAAASCDMSLNQFINLCVERGIQEVERSDLGVPDLYQPAAPEVTFRRAPVTVELASQQLLIDFSRMMHIDPDWDFHPTGARVMQTVSASSYRGHSLHGGEPFDEGRYGAS